MSTLSTSFTFSPNTTINSSQMNTNFSDVKTWANGNVDGANMTASAKEQLGLNDGTTVRRGKSIIATEESRTNTAYGTLTTPDQVTGVVLPTDGLIVVVFQAMWKASVASAGSAALFIGANQAKVVSIGEAAPQAQEAVSPSTVNSYSLLASGSVGLVGCSQAVVAYTGHVTTGQVVGITGAGDGGTGGARFRTGAFLNTLGPEDFACGVCKLFAAAGTYTVSCQFKSTSGSVTVKERKLWVEARGF